ncbi:DUF4301 family protein [Maribacter chungangensis]|uniref:DUF4301 family protein n=1 Tax=Maribacter chungangensis TaxID=1069117 RepID=A0ABW3B8D9_9FLAO
MMELTKKDKDQLTTKGISAEKVARQIETFKEGIPFVNLKSAAVVGDGIYRFTLEEEQHLVATYSERSKHLKIQKFVPASGAASRMFKALFSFLGAFDPKNETLAAYVKRTNDKDIQVFADGLEKFPFYDDVKSRLEIIGATRGEEVYAFVKELLDEGALNYGFYPKGLLPFHKYGTTTVTPFQEHLKEGALYAASSGKSQLHFTISEQHEAMFNNELKNVRKKVQADTGVEFDVDYSFQKSATDTIAVNMDNSPFRNADGSLLFRPGGHGALIENLNDQDADIIFIKNIDNVAVTRDSDAIAQSKKILAGLLLEAQEKAFLYTQQLKKGNEDSLHDIGTFVESKLNAKLPEGYAAMSQKSKVDFLLSKLQRPIRVCGMVKNEGEPGGGPFWITNGKGELSLQIIESAQIDMNKPEQVAILKNATHFNPVDLVCGVRDYEGKKYNLLDFVDHKQGFITGKTKDGKELKALELPGLWNGAMAYWNTIFVEVPLVTFNPVKTVNDLLKPSHQG